MGRTQQNRDEDTPESVLAPDTKEPLSGEMVDWLQGLKARWMQEPIRYADAGEENKAYSWFLDQVGWILRFLDEQKSQRPASEYEEVVIYELQQLRVVTQAHLESVITERASPEYIQTIQRLRAEMMCELDEFV